MMAWKDRIAEKEPVFAGRCEWCATVCRGREGVEVLMPGSGTPVTTRSSYHRFCNEACAKKYDAAEKPKHRHPDCKDLDSSDAEDSDDGLTPRKFTRE